MLPVSLVGVVVQWGGSNHLPLYYADSGSRGAGGVKNTIKNYFQSQSEPSTNPGAANFNHIKENKEKDKDVKEAKDSTAPPTAPVKDTTAAAVSVVDLATQLMPPPSRVIPAAKAGVVAPPSAGTVLEMRKQIDLLKLGKEVAESRVRQLANNRSFIPTSLMLMVDVAYRLCTYRLPRWRKRSAFWRSRTPCRRCGSRSKCIICARQRMCLLPQLDHG